MDSIGLIPYPKKIEMFEGELLLPAGISRIDMFEAQIASFQKLACKVYSIDIPYGEDGIRIILDRQLHESAYRLDCTDSLILTVSDVSGFVNGLSSILQLMKRGRCINTITFPKLKIYDYPNLPYRGLMIDVARQYHPFEKLLNIVDLCFLFKINHLQLHFSDTQAFTLPISQITSRDEKDFYYTKQQIKELCEYATGKGITIVPEVEMPGHSDFLVSVLKKTAFPDSKHQFTLCAAWLKKFYIIEDILRQVCELFPNSPYIHLGADEVRTEEWEQCEECKSYCKALGLPSTKELYSHFVARLTDAVISLGRRPIVWEGFPKKAAELVSKKTIVMVFESYYHQAQELVDEGFDIINATWKPLYITEELYWPYVDIYKWNPDEFDHWFDKSKAYDEKLVLNDWTHLLGCQMCSWEGNYQSEMPVVKKNIMAFGEKVWGTGNFQPEAVEFRSRARQQKLRDLVEKLINQ